MRINEQCAGRKSNAIGYTLVAPMQAHRPGFRQQHPGQRTERSIDNAVANMPPATAV
jgi:hypothetical protein